MPHRPHWFHEQPPAMFEILPTAHERNPEFMKLQVHQRLWQDERGTTDFVALIFVTAIAAMGCLVGVAVIRDQVTQEMGDIAVALDNVDQSFSYDIVLNGNSIFTNPPIGYTDNQATLTDVANAAPACLTLNVVAPTSEGGVPPAPTGDFP